MWKPGVGAFLLTLALSTHVAAAQTVSLSELTSYSVRLKKLVVEGSLTESERQKIIGEVEAEPIGADTIDQALREVSDKVRFAFQDRGYFKAVVGDASLLASSEDSHQLDVSVKVPDTGALYRLKDISRRRHLPPKADRKRTGEHETPLRKKGLHQFHQCSGHEVR